MAKDRELQKLIKQAENAKEKVSAYREKRASKSWRELVKVYRPVRHDKAGNVIKVSTHHGHKTTAKHTIKDFQDFQAHYAVIDRNSQAYQDYMDSQKDDSQDDSKNDSQDSDNQGSAQDNSQDNDSDSGSIAPDTNLFS